LADKDETPPVDGGIVKFTAGPQLWAYLTWLSKHTILGKTPGEVAQQVLIQRLSDMKAEDFKADKL
jgi:hypothetical protein